MRYDKISYHEFEKVVNSTMVYTKSRLFLGKHEVDAINRPMERVIYLSRERLGNASNVDFYRLVFHEYISLLLKDKDRNYQITNDFIGSIKHEIESEYIHTSEVSGALYLHKRGLSAKKVFKKLQSMYENKAHGIEQWSGMSKIVISGSNIRCTFANVQALESNERVLDNGYFCNIKLNASNDE